MNLNRRSFFAALAAAPVIAKVAPKVEPPPVSATAFGPNPYPAALQSAYVPTVKQRELLCATEREILFTGGRGAGMTFGSARWLEQCDRMALWVVHSFADQKFHMDHFSANWSLTFSRSTAHTTQATIHVVTLDGLQRLMGMRFDRIAFDIHAPGLKWSVYRSLRDSQPWARLLVATPPSSRKSRMPEYFSANGRRLIHTTMLDNPALAELAESKLYRNMQNQGGWWA